MTSRELDPDEYKDGFLSGYDGDDWEGEDRSLEWLEGYRAGQAQHEQDRKDLDATGSSNT